MNPIRNTANISSGLTSLIIKKAQQCDQETVLNRLKNIQPPPRRPSPKSAIYSSILEFEASRGCPRTPQELLSFPQKATTSSTNTRSIQQNAILCGTSGPNRVIQPVCPGPTAAQLNSTTPKPSIDFCYSKRIYN